MISTHIVATVCSVVSGGSYHDALSCNSKSQFSPTSVQKGMVFFFVVFVSAQRLVARQLPTETIDRRSIPKDNGRKNRHVSIGLQK